MEEVELRVEIVAQVKLDHDFAAADLPCQPPKPRFVVVSRKPDGKLLPELLRQPPPKLQDFRIVDQFVVHRDGQGVAQFSIGRLVHTDQKAAGLTVLP